jgi:hypothetical protein
VTPSLILDVLDVLDVLDTVDGFVYLVGQLALLLAVAALLGALVGRYGWARRRVSRLEAEVERLRARPH